MSTGTTTTDGIVFGPTAAGTQYISLNYHRGGRRPDKNFWSPAFPPQDEFALFETAEAAPAWEDAQQHLWGVSDQGETELGLRGERVAKFPCPQNPTDQWHGYPVSPKERDTDRPPDEVIDLWIELGAITRVWARRIQRRKV